MIYEQFKQRRILSMNFKIVMDAVNQLTEEQAKQLLMEIMTAKSYSNQELIQKVQEIIERMEGVQ